MNITAFFNAIRTGDIDTITHFLEQGNRVIYTHGLDEYHRSPLDVAFNSGANRGIVDALLNAGVNITVDNILFAARYLNHETISRLCLSGGIRGHSIINEHNSDGWNPLQLALHRYGGFTCLRVINLLLDNGADPNMHRPCTALTTAVMYERGLFIADALLRRGADPNLFDSEGRTTLHAAFEKRYCERTIKHMVRYGGNVNIGDSNGFTILHYAVRKRNRCRFIHWLLNSGDADCHACTTGRRTALHMYAQHGESRTAFNMFPERLGHRSIFAALIQAGADVNAIDITGSSPLYYAAGAGHRYIVEALLLIGANPNLSDGNNRFPLHTALECYRNEIVQILLGSGANANAPNSEGYRPLHLAIRMNGGYDFVRILIQHNCDVNLGDNRGASALHHAVIKGDVAHMRTLIEARANVNIQDANGMTPLHYAVLNPDNFITAICLLSETASEMRIADRFGRPALYYALRRQNPSFDQIFYLIRQRPLQIR